MGDFTSLPDELIEYIFSNLPPYRDLINCSLVCKRWYYIAQNVLHHKRQSLNKALVDFNLCWKQFQPPPSAGPTIAPRYSHSAVYHKNCVYVFGGSSINGAFNDLWILDLSRREWRRPSSLGNYPNPKSCASFVAYKNQLILFGGRRQTNSFEPFILFDELHIYDIQEKRWTVKHGVKQGPNPTAAHSASVHKDKMVIFGGFRTQSDSHGSTNDVWVLDLKTYEWRKPRISDLKPSPRYGQHQIPLDDTNLLVLGGCGGPNSVFSDAWLLDMSGEIWRWQSVPIKNRKWTASAMWCNPACKVDDKIVAFGPTPAMPFEMKIIKQQVVPQAAGRPRTAEEPQGAAAVPRPSPPPQRSVSAHSSRSNNNEEPAIAPAPVPPLAIDRNQNNSYNDAAIRLQKNLHIRASMESTMPRRFGQGFSEPIIHGTIKMAAFHVDNSKQVQAIQRERQIESIRRMEQKLQSQRAQQRREEEAKTVKRAKKNCLAIFVCDISEILTGSGSIEWLEYKNFGIVPNAPEKRMLSTVVAGVGELILFGGLQRETTENVTNNVHFLTVPSTII